MIEATIKTAYAIMGHRDDLVRWIESMNQLADGAQIAVRIPNTDIHFMLPKATIIDILTTQKGTREAELVALGAEPNVIASMIVTGETR